MSYHAKLIPPVSVKDPRVLGTGGSKFAWKSKYMKGAVINSFDWQRRKHKPYGMLMDKWNIEYNH